MNKFNNYQLYKTSVLLGGQMKMDIILDASSSNIYINDFHISPISKYVPFNKHFEKQLLSYPHQNNISDFYKNTVGSFYENYIEPQLNHDWPIIDDSKLYDDTFFSGCKRTDSNVYKKQFEFFCPLWLEYVPKDSHLEFKIYIYDDKREIATKIVKLNHNNYTNHNKFVDYINNYFEYIGIDTGCNDIININFTKLSAHLRGLDVTSGNIVIHDLINLPYNLLSRERPLLENDYMIATSYKNTKTIVPNLFNFNFCFNIEDIITNKRLVKSIYGRRLKIGCDVSLVSPNGKIELEKRDIYTNYEYIPKIKCEPIKNIEETRNKMPDAPNILDYNKDYKYISHINKNKIVQKIPHWQLMGNDEYIFNVYEGFRAYLNDGINRIFGDVYITDHPVIAGTWMIGKGMGTVKEDVLILKEENKRLECYNRYADTPDILQTRYSKSLNNVGWASCVNLNSNSYNLLFNNDFIMEKYTTILSYGWHNFLFYKNPGNESIELPLILGYINKPDYNDIINKLQNEEISDDGKIVFAIINNILLICSTDINQLTFASVKTFLKTNLNNIKSNEIKQKLQNLYKLMKSIKTISMISINNRLGIVRADSPDVTSDEIDYKKIDDNTVYMLRYDGKIKPNIIPTSEDYKYKNYIYRKLKLDEYTDDSKLSSFKNYTESGYSPLYPSINYWAYSKEFINYKIPPSYIKDVEYKWFDNSYIICTEPKINLEVSSVYNTKTYINIEIKNELKKQMNITNDDIIDKIFDLYDIYYNLKDNIGGTYNYEIKMSFK